MLPYKAEYFSEQNNHGWKDNCRTCKRGFKQGELRLSAKVQSGKHDGKESLRYHSTCFFTVQRPRDISTIENFENLRYEDQQSIQATLVELDQPLLTQNSSSSASSSKRKSETLKEKLETELSQIKKPKVGTSSNDAKSSAKRPAVPSIILGDFSVEYSVSSRAECVGCRLKIMKGLIRVKKIVYFTEVGMKFGGQAFCHHLDCFAKICGDEYGFYLSGDRLPGFGSLSKDDQEVVRQALPAVGADKLPVKKKKTQNAPVDVELESKIAEQTQKFFKVRDKLKRAAIPVLQQILKKNRSAILTGEELLDRCADFISFGALAKCQKCKKGDMMFDKHGYRCNAVVDEWSARCGNFEEKPMRLKCQIPDALKENFKSAPVQDRAVRPKVKFEPVSDPFAVKVERNPEPLYNMHFVAIGTFDRAKMKRRIEAMGGKLVGQIQGQIAAVISTLKEVEKMNQRMRKVEELEIQVVPESFLNAVIGGTPADTIENIKSMAISEWGSDPLTRIPQEETRGQRESIYSRGVKKVANVKLKNGTAVDPDSDLADDAHVYQRDGVLYTTVLGLTDIQLNKNSYFKIQVLQSDNLRSFWVFSSWGRIGTRIGDKNLEHCGGAQMACVEFERLYKEKTGNTWNSDKPFRKLAGKFYPIDVDYDDDMNKKLKLEEDSKIPSKLQQPVQDLVKMLFDVNAMKATMLEFELDLQRMPLGRLSKKQLEEANATLAELDKLVLHGATSEEFVSLSNKFYTLVPHSVGMKSLPVIDTLEAIKNKRDMIESLLEIQIAYSMLQKDVNDEMNPLDCRYEQLKTDLTPLKHTTKEFKLIEQYVANTHAETHNQYKLVIEDVFKVKREGEAAIYKPFNKLHNRQLLWHGSRVTNFAGILSNGLKIAPPEAPVTGYMFGKGIYFADMVSKSANYCFTTPDNPTGLLLLSEVALGNCYELMHAKNIVKLPENMHSTKGVGKTFPDPSMTHETRGGLKIPLGKSMTNDKLQSSLLYNEFIVYDVAQVNVKYLIKMKFDYKR